MEVYLGSTPGRPRLLMLLTGSLLVGTLALAWAQSHAARALGQEQRIPDTPLLVRLPPDWKPDPERPQRFLLPVKDQSTRSRKYSFERRVGFGFDRLSTFKSPGDVLPMLGVDNQQTVYTSRATRIGPFAAIEVHKLNRVPMGRVLLNREVIVRVAVLPDGHVIHVTYEPLDNPRPGDLEILDDVCDTIRVDDPQFNQTAASYLSGAGLEFTVGRDRQVVGPYFEQAPGLHVGGIEDGVPSWSLGWFRTWLAPGRTPRDLLADIAAQDWLVHDLDPLLRDLRRADGASLLAIRHPRFAVADVPLPAVWIVAQSPTQVVLGFVYAGPSEAEAAYQAAEKIATEIRIAPLDAFSQLDEAVRAGETLVNHLHQVGPVPRWGREAVEINYLGRTPGGDERITLWRQAHNRDPALGYEGGLDRRPAIGRGVSPDEKTKWTLDGRAVAYTWNMESFYDASTPVEVNERRRSADTPVSRELIFKGQDVKQWSFRPGANFAPPPAVSILSGWVARGEPEQAVLQQSSPFGPATHSIWLRHLTADGKFPRVFVQRDFWPTGAIEAYDDDLGDTEYELYPTAEFRRLPDQSGSPTRPRGRNRP